MANNRIRLKSSGQNLGNITLSVGGAQYAPGEALGTLIERADEASIGPSAKGAIGSWSTICRPPPRPPPDGPAAAASV